MGNSDGLSLTVSTLLMASTTGLSRLAQHLQDLPLGGADLDGGAALGRLDHQQGGVDVLDRAHAPRRP